MSRLNGSVLAILAVLCGAVTAAACEDDPDDLDYLKAGSGAAATGGNAGSSCIPTKCGDGCAKCGAGGQGGKAGGGTASGSAGQGGAASDADAG